MYDTRWTHQNESCTGYEPARLCSNSAAKRYPKYLSPSLSGLDSAIMLNHVGKILSNSREEKAMLSNWRRPLPQLPHGLGMWMEAHTACAWHPMTRVPVVEVALYYQAIVAALLELARENGVPLCEVSVCMRDNEESSIERGSFLR